jgi:hypothetical protein
MAILIAYCGFRLPAERPKTFSTGSRFAPRAATRASFRTHEQCSILSVRCVRR